MIMRVLVGTGFNGREKICGRQEENASLCVFLFLFVLFCFCVFLGGGLSATLGTFYTVSIKFHTFVLFEEKSHILTL